MPSSVTHTYIAEDVYKKLDKRVKKKIKKEYLKDYKVYSHGPDIYFFMKIVSPLSFLNKDIREFGEVLHNEKVNEVFISLCKQIKESKDINQFLFLMGLATHYQADTTIHPYINYKGNLLIKKHFTRRDGHFLIETYIDNYMINKREDIDYKKFKIYDHSFNLEKKEEVVNLLNNTFKEVFKLDNMGNIYFKSLKDMKLFFKYLRYDPIGYKKYFYKLVNIFAKRLFRDVRYLSYNFKLDKDIYYLNLNHDTWYNICDKSLKSNKSFLELYDEVIIKSKDMIEKLYDYVFLDKEIDLEKLFKNLSYSNGLPLK